MMLRRLISNSFIFLNRIWSFFTAPLKFRVATVPSSRHPDEFKVQGLRNLPAIIHGNRVAIDTVEEIVDYIDSQFPGIRYFADGSLERLYLLRGPLAVNLNQDHLI